jgi:serine/threonine protein kinase
MLTEQLSQLSYCDLLQLAKTLDLPTSRSRSKLIEIICKQYNDLQKYISYTYIKQLGVEGKDGRTFLALDKNGREVAIKIFKPSKSIKSIQKEAQLQMIAFQHGIAPEIYECNAEGRFIVMEKMDVNLFDCFRKQQGKLTIAQQKAIITLFHKLDECKVFHGDPNPLNFMCKNGKWFIIDFGLSKLITKRNMSKYSSEPNITYMPLGFKMKLQSVYSDCKLEYIDQFC